MDEKFAVVFSDGSQEAAGALEVKQDRLQLRGRGNLGTVELAIPYSDLSGVRIGRRPSDRLNGYRTLVLERSTLPAIRVAPLGVALLGEIANLLTTLSEQTEGDLLAVSVPLNPGCLPRARKLLAKGPPIDPARLGLSSHDVYLDHNRAIFVFRGPNARAHLSRAIRLPALWRAGLAWQRCFAAAPQIINTDQLPPDTKPAYHWQAG
jgi:hypothetical protein